MKKFMISAAILIITTATAAADVPRHDPEAHCTRLFPDSAQMSNFCLGQEQDEYDALKGEWASYSEAAQAHCTRLFDSSYKMLRFCLQRETTAEGDKKPFKF